MRMTAKQARELAFAEAAKIVVELQDEMKLRGGQLPNVTGALAVAFMRGMSHATQGITNDMMGGIGRTLGVRPRPRRS